MPRSVRPGEPLYLVCVASGARQEDSEEIRVGMGGLGICQSCVHLLSQWVVSPRHQCHQNSLTLRKRLTDNHSEFPKVGGWAVEKGHPI